MTTAAVDRVNRCFARLTEVDRPEAWISIRPQGEVIAEAAEIDRRTAAGEALPLAGLVFGVKDNIDVTGLPTTAGHPGFSHLPERTATAVARLIEAGALVIGKTNLDQFATGLVGTRSPYGAVRNARHPERISGGSSAGSAVAVALGVVDFALGTDTAGSGRVPAALNRIVGLKSSYGIVPLDGVVPACRSYDCVTAFAADVGLATAVTRIMAGPSALSPSSRAWPADVVLGAPPAPRVAVPAPRFLDVLSAPHRASFAASVESLVAHGAVIAEIDLQPFLDCARLLYDGALVSERSAAYGEFLAGHPDGADPTVARIAAAAATRTGPELVADQEAVARYRLLTRGLLEGFDALLVPTAPEHPTLAEVSADPLGVNSRMGLFTNFMNLLDMAGVAVPAAGADIAGDGAADGEFGVTVVVRGFEDQVAVDLAAVLTGEDRPPVLPTGGIELALFGAHLSGQPLNHQLVERGARLVGPVRTSADYRMVALPTTPAKPGIVRATGAGVSLAAEIWSLSPAALGDFLALLPRPMALGRLTFADGVERLGFLCSEPEGPDISAAGGWLNHLAGATPGTPSA
ncbi:allophanate hydrolase [Herbiconiux sp. 11R-BC]|uniref:allophanate hydrolase n=1 Tax=Herbiconiux sp. 11R-BC TaxID=3111637 RepID=UPI003C0D9442